MKLLKKLFVGSKRAHASGLAVIRIGFGCISVLVSLPILILIRRMSTIWDNLSAPVRQIIHLVFPDMWEMTVVYVIFFAGVALVFGFATRLASLVITIIMISVISTAIRSESLALLPLLFTLPPLLLISVGLCISGSGRYSLDNSIFK